MNLNKDTLYIPLFASKPTKLVKFRPEFVEFAKEFFGSNKLPKSEYSYWYYSLITKALDENGKPFAYHLAQYWENVDRPDFEPVFTEESVDICHPETAVAYFASPIRSLDVDEFDILQFDRKPCKSEELIKILYEWIEKRF